MAIVLLVGVLCVWIFSFIAGPWQQVLPAFLLLLLNTGLVWFLMLHTGVTRDRDGLAPLLYAATITAFPFLHANWRAQLVIAFALWMLIILHRGFREEDTSRDSFSVTLLALLASLVVPDMIWLVVVVWLSYLFISSLTIRSFLASLIAIATFAVYLGLSVLLGWLDFPYLQLFHRQWLFEIAPVNSAIGMVAWCAIGIYFLAMSAIRIDRDSANQQTLLILLAVFYVVSTILTLFPVAIVPIQTLFPIALAALLGMAVLFFRQCETVTRGVVFILYWLLLIVTYVLNSFSLFTNL